MLDNQRTALIVEGCKDDDQDYVKLFEEKEFHILMAPKDGIAVSQMIAEQRPDVVVMSLFMINIDALGVMETVKKMNMEKPPVLVVLSSFSTPKIEKSIMSADAQLFLIPFDANVMVSRIIQICNADATPLPEPKQTVSVDDLELMVTDIIHQIGVPAHIKGYHYVRSSIMHAVLTPDIINSVTKCLYPTVAKEYATTPSRVERAIRHAIEVAWDRGDVDTLNSYFGYTIHNGRGKPTNSEFVAMISDKLRLQLRGAL